MEKKICPVCSGLITARYPAELKEKTYCSRSCAATVNNQKYPKKRTKVPPTGVCSLCGDIVKNTLGARSGKSYFYERKYCDKCLDKATGRGKHRKLLERTLADLKSSCSNNQSMRSLIVQHSRQVYEKSGKPKVCKVCGYIKHVQICHIRPWTDFPDTALIREINNIKNLVALCPTHHWELDHNQLDAPLV